MTPEEALRRRWGYDSFKPLQKEAVEAALAGKDCLVVLPTGGGKSLCYQLPAAVGQGLVLVVSPLIALMDDQVAAAREAGLAADALHSNLEADHRGEAYRRLAAGKTDLLYVSPERLLMGDILEDIAARLVLVAVDEAHFDRSNVRYVVHANTPKSVEHYQQESGRAGRDGLPAECVLLFAASDLTMHRLLAHKDGALPPERERALERHLREIGRYAVAPVCRHSLLAEHFGAPYPPSGNGRPETHDVERDSTATPARELPRAVNCGACDVCLGETQGLPAEDALLAAKKVLSGAWRAGGRFGAGYVVNLLLGRGDERMRRNGHETLRVFGLLKESGEAAVRSWIDQLIVQGFLEIFEEREYPLLRITESGKALCRDVGTVRLGVPVPPAARGKKKRRPSGMGDSPDPSPDRELFERLRHLRRIISEKLNVPPYVVFHDSALVEMAAVKPGTLDALGGVKGVGEHKLKRYGAAFLKVISGEPPESVAVPR